MELIDTHAHLTYEELAKDLDQVLNRSRVVGVRTWITVGTGPEENRRALELAGREADLYAVLGIHPHHAGEVADEDLERLAEDVRSKKVVALGETGLDFHYTFSEPDRQKEVFRTQLEIAAAAELPVVIHSREAFAETEEILSEFDGRLKGVVFHCFSGDAADAERLLAKGCHLSFTGIVTFKNAEATREAVKVVPLERMMIETDCPYLSPAPVRNQRPCEPGLLIHTAARIAEIKGMPLERLAAAVTRTSRAFFGLPEMRGSSFERFE